MRLLDYPRIVFIGIAMSGPFAIIGTILGFLAGIAIGFGLGRVF